MKKLIITMLVMTCLLLTGCNNKFAQDEYDSNQKIVETADRYAKEISVFNPIDGGYSLTVSKFDGRETLWSKTLEESQEMDITFTFRLSSGKAKVVYIDQDDNVTTLVECTPDTSTEEPVTQTVSLQSGKNRLKIVGYDCKDLNLKMLFDEPE